MGKMCYLCRLKASKRDGISLFMIPKNPIIRQKWMQACDLSPSDDLRCIYICSMHFSDNDMDRGNQFQTRCTLKIGAIPSIGMPNKSFNEVIDTLNEGTKKNVNDLDEVVESTNRLDNIVINTNTLDDDIVINKTSDRTISNVKTLHIKIDESSTMNTKSDIINAQRLQLAIHPTKTVPFDKCDSFMKRRHLITANVTSDCKVDENFTTDTLLMQMHAMSQNSRSMPNDNLPLPQQNTLEENIQEPEIEITVGSSSSPPSTECCLGPTLSFASKEKTKRQKLDNETSVDMASDLLLHEAVSVLKNVSSSLITNTNDEIVAFGQSVIAQLGKLPEEYQIECMSEIQNVITLTRLKYLRSKQPNGLVKSA